jgi:hypothetical protein
MQIRMTIGLAISFQLLILSLLKRFISSFSITLLGMIRIALFNHEIEPQDVSAYKSGLADLALQRDFHLYHQLGRRTQIDISH